MSHATKTYQRSCRRSTRELTVHHRGRAATPALRVEVRREVLTTENEEKLARLALLQRLEHVHRKISVLLRLHERAAADQLDHIC